MTRTLSHQEARKTYDFIGSFQDHQGFYEDFAVRDLVAHSDFENANSIIEFGHGTGRHAARLLSHSLPPTAKYLGVDQSATMARLANARLAPWQDRIELRLTDGSMQIDAPAQSFDRFFSTYVLDLLSEEDISLVLSEAHRLLRKNGRLCLVGLTRGRTWSERFVIGALDRVFEIKPQWIGGCRAIDLLHHLPQNRWRLLYRSVISPFAIPSEVLVATPLFSHSGD